MTELPNSSALERIRTNIENFGHHVYLVSGAPTPRFAYTIGLGQRIGREFILAGASFYTAEGAKRIIDGAAAAITGTRVPTSTVAIDSLGEFSFRNVDASWANELMIGALHYYNTTSLAALQIVPDPDHSTRDVPDMSQPWHAKSEPVWKWLHEAWTLPAPRSSVAMTNLAALRGERITEAARWEEDYWELFAGPGPDVAEEDARAVPLGTLLAMDHSLEACAYLEVGQALWRDLVEVEWHPWTRQ